MRKSSRVKRRSHVGKRKQRRRASRKRHLNKSRKRHRSKRNRRFRTLSGGKEYNFKETILLFEKEDYPTIHLYSVDHILEWDSKKVIMDFLTNVDYLVLETMPSLDAKYAFCGGGLNCVAAQKATSLVNEINQSRIKGSEIKIVGGDIRPFILSGLSMHFLYNTDWSKMEIANLKKSTEKISMELDIIFPFEQWSQDSEAGFKKMVKLSGALGLAPQQGCMMTWASWGPTAFESLPPKGFFKQASDFLYNPWYQRGLLLRREATSLQDLPDDRNKIIERLIIMRQSVAAITDYSMVQTIAKLPKDSTVLMIVGAKHKSAHPDDAGSSWGGIKGLLKEQLGYSTELVIAEV